MQTDLATAASESPAGDGSSKVNISLSLTLTRMSYFDAFCIMISLGVIYFYV